MRQLIVIFVALLATQVLQAQNTTITVRSEKTGKQEVIDVPESLLKDMDKMYQDWQSKTFINLNGDCELTSTNPTVSDEVIIDRLSRIPSVIEMPFNEAVRKFIDLYATSLRKKVSFMLAAANFYNPLFEEALDLYDLPLELKYLPIIESALDPKAVSRRGASGLWQFMLTTGRYYGLKTNSLVDERLDPIKSTWAAVHYLKDLYDIYKDWSLTLAAYNCGPGTINKAIKRAGGATDYWLVYPYLPKETRGYVPAFIAANYIMTYYCEHGICPMEAELPLISDTIMVNQNVHLNQIAEVCDIDLDQLRSLNPQYRRDIVPGTSEPSALRLPDSLITTFIEKESNIIAYQSSKYLNRRQTVAIRETAARNTSRNSRGKATTSSGAQYYKIRKGDTLGSIAARNRTTVSKLRQLNGIRGNNIIAGKSIRIR